MAEKMQRSVLIKFIGYSAVISGLVMFVTLVLDAYNPFMNFIGHAMPVQILLCVRRCSVPGK